MCLYPLLANLVCNLVDTGNSDVSSQNMSMWYNKCQKITSRVAYFSATVCFKPNKLCCILKIMWQINDKEETGGLYILISFLYVHIAEDMEAYFWKPCFYCKVIKHGHI